jgi:hypothetical protein
MNISLAPTSLLSISDHITRYRVKNKTNLFYGILLGTEDRLSVHIAHSVQGDLETSATTARVNQLQEVYPRNFPLGIYINSAATSDDFDNVISSVPEFQEKSQIVVLKVDIQNLRNLQIFEFNKSSKSLQETNLSFAFTETARIVVSQLQNVECNLSQDIKSYISSLEIGKAKLQQISQQLQIASISDTGLIEEAEDLLNKFSKLECDMEIPEIEAAMSFAKLGCVLKQANIY